MVVSWEEEDWKRNPKKQKTMDKISNRKVQFSFTHSEELSLKVIKKICLVSRLGEKPCVGGDISDEPERVPLQDL